MAEPDRAALARELAQYARPPAMEADEFSILDYAEATRVDWQTARSDLERLVREGRATERKAFDHRVHRLVRVYRKTAGCG